MLFRRTVYFIWRGRIASGKRLLHIALCNQNQRNMDRMTISYIIAWAGNLIHGDSTLLMIIAVGVQLGRLTMRVKVGFWATAMVWWTQKVYPWYSSRMKARALENSEIWIWHSCWLLCMKKSMWRCLKVLPSYTTSNLGRERTPWVLDCLIADERRSVRAN